MPDLSNGITRVKTRFEVARSIRTSEEDPRVTFTMGDELRGQKANAIEESCGRFPWGLRLKRHVAERNAVRATGWITETLRQRAKENQDQRIAYVKGNVAPKKNKATWG